MLSKGFNMPNERLPNRYGSEKNVEDTLRRKYQSKVNGLMCEIIDIKEENGGLLQAVKNLKEEIKKMKSETVNKMNMVRGKKGWRNFKTETNHFFTYQWQNVTTS